MPSGESGTVIDVRIFTRRGVEKNGRALLIEKAEIEKLNKNYENNLNIIRKAVESKLFDLVKGQKLKSKYKVFDAGTEITEEVFNRLNPQEKWLLPLTEADEAIEDLKDKYDATKKEFTEELRDKIDKVQSSDHLPQGALKIVKVYVARKLRLQPGDKMAGRHGNKGVVSKVLPVEDMPYMEDGTPVDIVLNPLGVPSRMNVGQILETHLGLAAKKLGEKLGQICQEVRAQKESAETIRSKLLAIYNSPNALDKGAKAMIEKLSPEDLLIYAEALKDGIPMASPPFDGASDEEISRLLVESGFDRSGQMQLIDGRTGETFARKTTVGYIHMLKLDHLVADKIHARSTGPYNLVTQQPLGGKQHFGGQRFGEMECWALEAYGAAYTLQEMLTVKSDDIPGRIKIYENIIRNDLDFEYGIPESFNVMVKEIKSLGLNIELLTDKPKED